jgi:hypothetical protein
VIAVTKCFFSSGRASKSALGAHALEHLVTAVTRCGGCIARQPASIPRSALQIYDSMPGSSQNWIAGISWTRICSLRSPIVPNATTQRLPLSDRDASDIAL